MGAFDISRYSFDPRRHYAGVRMQQGRVLMDDDWNANEQIENEERRKTRTEVIGPFGSPDQGFKIQNATFGGGLVDFDILPGTMHLGGLRLDMELASPGQPETFRLQKDWLQQALAVHTPPSLADLTVADRYDLVYLEAWQQGVRAVEDNELFEAALGGPDTTGRVRTMRRVRIAENMASRECSAAFAELRQRWITNNFGTLNSEHCLARDTQLRVTLGEPAIAEDLCTPSLAGGYLGAENQAIRVQLLSDTEFTWGFDNASSLYRVRMIDPTTVEFVTLPPDQRHWPLADQTVEILPWSAVLSNGEKIADINGHMSKVSASYNADTHQLSLTQALPAGFGENYTNRSDAAVIDEAGAEDHFYLRVWYRGSDTISPARIPIAASNTLGNTGLSVEISGDDRLPGDHWIIAARPETRDEVVPWALQTQGLPAFGVDRYFAPLAILRWYATDGPEIAVEVIRDCRKTFRPLTDLESCCTFHVGDGQSSFGDFNSIEEAVANLPETGGQICVLPGTHFANVELLNLRDIVISGCGYRSIVLPHQEQLNFPIFGINSCHNITIRNLNLIHTGGTAIRLIDTAAGEQR
ncbi:MAG: DUF6519 domain-containing protein [Bacteroidota bacterium]